MRFSPSQHNEGVKSIYEVKGAMARGDLRHFSFTLRLAKKLSFDNLFLSHVEICP